MAWAWEQPTKTGHKLVLLALADHAGEDMTCFPSTARLAEKTGFSVRTVRAYLDDLEREAFVIKLRRRRRPDGTLGTWLYRLNSQSHPDATGCDDQTDDDVDQSHPDASGSGTPLASGCRTSDIPIASPVTSQMRAEPSSEPSIDHHLPHVNDFVTREDLAAAAAEEHVNEQIAAGVQVESRRGLARWKQRQLLDDEADKLHRLLDRDARRRAAGEDPIPMQVLARALLGDDQRLAYFPYPCDGS